MKGDGLMGGIVMAEKMEAEEDVCRDNHFVTC